MNGSKLEMLDISEKQEQLKRQFEEFTAFNEAIKGNN
jgi:hypothetical protein